MKQITNIKEYFKAYEHSVNDPEGFWGEVAGHFQWQRKWDRVLQWEFDTPAVEWFKGGKLNLTENCLDRHLVERPDQVALIWEPNDPTEQFKSITYRELHREVCRLSNALLKLGVKKGDRVCIYLPMVLEGAMAMLACARIGAIHSVVFAGFSSSSLVDRINDADCNLILTADAVYRGDKKIELKKIVDEALELTPSIKHCVVLDHRQTAVSMKPGRDIWWHDALNGVSELHQAETMDAEDPLFILYTSGSTGKPKGVLHTTAGYMVYAGYTFNNVFNYQEKEVFFCTADIGWVTGHSYMVYGPLLNGATSIIFEGTPVYPDHGRFWDVVDKHRVNILYTAPTAIRSLEKFGPAVFESKDLSSLRVLGSVGEPINEEAWEWYHHHVGKGKCPIVDTWWQTETGGILISPIAYTTVLKPAYATLPLPGVQPVLMDDKGNEINGNGVEGNLCIKFPWPGMARSVYGDHPRFKSTYFSTYKGYYFTGDGCKRDHDGYYRITGRVDDVVNVSGHRIGTGELEDAINEHNLVVESAVVGYPHEVKGQALYAFVICHIDDVVHSLLEQEIRALVADKIGPFAKPDKIQVVPGLPKTRSGKIMRRILRKIAEGETSNLGDTTTLLDPSIVDKIMEGKR
ncbi:MAG: acetate--CoA ligase [Chitinophagales bacterium]|nr:acetate--CoA ligase [Chitinophagales bacterium]